VYEGFQLCESHQTDSKAVRCMGKAEISGWLSVSNHHTPPSSPSMRDKMLLIVAAVPRLISEVASHLPQLPDFKYLFWQFSYVL
jgi:hypothetical protein